MSEQFKSFFNHDASSGSRSTIMQPLIWLFLTLILGVTSSVYFNAPPWVTILFTVLLFMLFILVYIYFMFKNPDSLRSEKFTLQKLALEHNIIGDSNTGVLVDTQTKNFALTCGDTKNG